MSASGPSGPLVYKSLGITMVFSQSVDVISLLYLIHCVHENSVDPDQLASSEAS